MIPLKRHHTFWKVLRAALIAAGLGGAACHTPAPNHPAVASPPLANHKATTEEREALDAALLMRRGIRLYHLKHLEEARLCFRTLRLQYPAFKDARTAAYTEICILQDLKVSTGLLELCQAFLAAYPDSKNADAVASLAGECLVEQAKWSEVANYYAKLETRFPKSPNLDRFTFYQGLAHFLAGEFALSTPFLESVIRDHPKSLLYEPALYHLAMTHFLNNEFQKTVATCNSYLAKFPDGPYAGDLQYRLSYIDSNDSGVKANKIISDLETFINAHPHDVCNGSMLCLLADTYKKAHEDDKALAAYQSALWSKSPDDVTQYALDCATTILQDKKDWNAIFEMLAEFLRKNPRSKLDLRVIGQGVNVNVRQGKPEQAVQTLTDALRPRVGNPAAEQVEYLLDLLVQTLVPRKRPAKEELAAVAEHLDQQLVETLTKVIGVTPNPTATARMLYARARLSQLLYRASRTERSDRLLKDLATDYADNPAALSPTLLSICGDILLEENNLKDAQAMYQRLTDAYKDSLFSDSGPLGLGKLALARKQPAAALKIFDDTLANNPGSSRFRETTLGKLQALTDLGNYLDARKLADQITGNKQFNGETAGKAHLMLAQIYRAEAAKTPPGDAATALLTKANATYQRVEISYQSLPEICAEAYWQAFEVAKELHDESLAAAALQALATHPKLQDTRRARDAKKLMP